MSGMSDISCETITSEELLEHYLAGKLGADDRDRLERHLLACDRCQQETRLALALRHELGREGQQPRQRPRRRWIAAGIGTAAAAVLLAVLIPRAVLDREGPEHRDVPGAEAALPAPLAPIGRVEGRPSRFVWSRVAGADRYRLTVLSGAGDVLLETETPDTSSAVPTGLDLGPGAPFFWKVDARIAWDRWIKSEVVEFAIEPVDAAPEASDR